MTEPAARPARRAPPAERPSYGPAPAPSAASYGPQPGQPSQRRPQAEAALPEARKARPRPNDELAKRRAERKERGAVDHGFDKRLGLDPRTIDTDNFEYYWALASDVKRLEGREWEVVPKDQIEGQEAARHAGYDEQAKPTQHVLMRKFKPWDREDRAERLKLNREQDAALLRGTAPILRDGGLGGADYASPNNSASTELVE